MLEAATRASIDLAPQHAGDELGAWVGHHGFEMRPINLQVVAGLDEELLMERMPSSLARWGEDIARAVSMELSTAIAGREPRDTLVDRVANTIQRERWKADRIVRTELSHAYNASHHATLKEVEERLGDGLKKSAIATFDERTGDDSIPVHGQVRRLDEMFVDGQYLHPPGRPNDREKEIPWLERTGAEILSREEGIERVVQGRLDIRDRRQSEQRRLEDRFGSDDRRVNLQRVRVENAERRAVNTAMKFGARNVVVETTLPLKREDFDKVMSARTQFWQQELKGKEGPELVAAMEDIRKRLLGDKFDRKEIFELVESTKNPLTGKFSERIIDRFFDDVEEVAALVGLGPSGLKGVQVEAGKHVNDLYTLALGWGHREEFYLFPAHVGQRRGKKLGAAYINVGDRSSGERGLIFHEFAHYIEDRNPRVRQASKYWLDSQPEKVPLWDEYIATTYEDGSTEVLSMGLEQFSSPDSMRGLYEADARHFSFIMSVLEGRWSFNRPE